MTNEQLQDAITDARETLADMTDDTSAISADEIRAQRYRLYALVAQLKAQT
jgi:hypothetical protein